MPADEVFHGAGSAGVGRGNVGVGGDAGIGGGRAGARAASGASVWAATRELVVDVPAQAGGVGRPGVDGVGVGQPGVGVGGVVVMRGRFRVGALHDGIGSAYKLRSLGLL